MATFLMMRPYWCDVCGKKFYRRPETVVARTENASLDLAAHFLMPIFLGGPS
jgi:hypothetical protein